MAQEGSGRLQSAARLTLLPTSAAMAEPTATLRQLDALGGPALQEVQDELIAALRHPTAESFSRCEQLA